MPAAPLPDNEAHRLAVLRSYDVLDTECEDTFDDITRLAARLTDCPTALISLVDADRQWFKARHGLAVSETPRADAFCAWAILDHAPMVIPDAALDARLADSPVVTRDGFRFYTGIPLRNGEGVALGTLCVLDRRCREISDAQIETMRSLARTVVTALELHKAVKTVSSMMLTDSLTGIGNRTGFMLALRQAALGRESNGFGVAYLDLDGFKQVNDRDGHAAGDAVLRQVAQHLRATMRAGDTAARLGGDEFALILAAEDCAAFEAAVDRLVRAIAADHEGRVTASVGALWCGTAGGDPAFILAEADRLMYAAKQAGKNQAFWRRLDFSQGLTASAA